MLGHLSSSFRYSLYAKLICDTIRDRMIATHTNPALDQIVKKLHEILQLFAWLYSPEYAYASSNKHVLFSDSNRTVHLLR